MQITGSPHKRSLYPSDHQDSHPNKRQKVAAMADEKGLDLTPILGILCSGSLSIKSIDPLSNRSFEELIQRQASNQQAYILALVANESGGFHYTDAVRLRKTDLNDTENKVERVYYFTLAPGANKFTYLGCKQKELDMKLLDRVIAGADAGEACYQLGNLEDDLKTAAHFYHLSSQHGSLLGHYMWAKCKRNGLGTESDPAEEAKLHFTITSKISTNMPACKSLLQLALADASNGDLFAQYILGKLTATGFGVEKDVNKAFEIFSNLAEQGYPPGHYEKAGCLLSAGSDVDADFIAAMKSLHYATGQNYPPAQFTLGRLLLTGNRYIEKNIQHGIKLIELAAEQGFSSALTWIIESMMTGRYLPHDPKAAFEMLTAVEGEDAQQQFLLARCYIEGIGTYKDLAKGMQFCISSARQGNGRANHLLGSCKEKGIGIDKDLEGAAQCYTAAANQRHLQAYSDLGRCYQYGIGMQIDLEAAVRNYKCGAERNCAAAQRLLALCLLGGLGTTKNCELAVKLLTRASEQNDAIATNELGFCFQHGIGTYQRLDEAIKAYSKAAEQGLPQAQLNLGFCFLKGIGGEMNLYKAAALFEKAAARGLPEAEYNLGLCKEYGWGTPEDKQGAEDLYNSAAQKNHKAAKIMQALDRQSKTS